MNAKPTLFKIAEYVPLGFECRGCGGSAYNWIRKCARYAETGEGCCADFRDWVRKAEAGEPTVEENHKARLIREGFLPLSATTAEAVKSARADSGAEDRA